jgi:hypothetical protein
MKRTLFAGAFATLLLIGLTGTAFAQAGSASLGGIVQDASKALIPGVTVTAKNVATAVTQTQVTNESGTYSFPVLQPGVYEISAELPGFKRSLQKDVTLPYAGQVRLNVTLEVGDVNQAVDVTVQRDSILRESSASVGDVLTMDKIQNLPMVGNNVLDLLNTLPGMRLSPLGDAFNTINGLGMNTVNTTRDGLSTVDTRFYPEFWGTRTFSTTTINPDLVGEIRLIVSPVDAELGRGSAQVQISTRSGTNRYSGTASWNIRNSAMDANTWTNNHTAFTDPITGALYNSTPKNWSNLHEYSIAYGGPIKVPGLYNGYAKTFFYTLWDQNIRNTRDNVNVNVLTDTARQGIFRYWSGYNPLGWNPSSTLAVPTFPLQSTTASFIAVDQRGNPIRPPADPSSTSINSGTPGFVPYSGNLMCFSVFGTQRLDDSGNMVPFTAADCPGGTISSPTGRPTWDPFRTTFDSSGLIRKFLQATPHPNYFGSGDGLNTAQLRWVRGRSGDINALNGVPTTIAGASNVGSSAFVNRKQLNVKVDHNFSTNHKVAVSYTLQRDDSADNCANYPGGLCGGTLRRPHVLTVNATSTITPQMVNEGRFGLNYTRNYTYAPWYSPIQEVADAARNFMLPAGTSLQNPSYQYLALVSSSLGNISPAAGFVNTGAAQVFAENPLYNWADTLSWSKGKHAFKFGFDWRLPRTTGNGSAVPDPTVTLGNAATSTASPVQHGVELQHIVGYRGLPAGLAEQRAHRSHGSAHECHEPALLPERFCRKRHAELLDHQQQQPNAGVLGRRFHAGATACANKSTRSGPFS